MNESNFRRDSMRRFPCLSLRFIVLSLEVSTWHFSLILLQTIKVHHETNDGLIRNNICNWPAQGIAPQAKIVQFSFSAQHLRFVIYLVMKSPRIITGLSLPPLPPLLLPFLSFLLCLICNFLVALPYHADELIRFSLYHHN